MEESKKTKLERLLLRLRRGSAEYALPFISALIFGLAAHMFAFTNKLVNADEIESLFGKGATVTSGRWGLELVKFIFPDYSVPWLWGIVSIVLLAVSACIIIRIFEIRSGLLRVLLAGIIVSFPSETGVFCFMFTSSAYALSFLFSVLSCQVFLKGRGVWKWVFAALLLVLSLSIYQAYAAVTASIFLLYMIKRCIDGGESGGRIIVSGLKYLAVMLIAVIVYLALSYVAFYISGAEFNDYVKNNVNDISLPGRIRMAYNFFYYTLSYREFALITNEASRYLHILCIAVCLGGVLWTAVRKIREKDLLTAALLLLCTVLLPLAMNSIYLVMAKKSVHTLVLYSFIAVYIFAALILDRVFCGSGAAQRILRDVLYISMAVTLFSNVFFANKVYLREYLQYENAYSFYSILLSRAENTAGFDENSKLAIIGVQDNNLYTFPELDTGYIMGPGRELVNIYSRENFLRRYLGTDIPLATEEELEYIEGLDEFQDMAEYPYYGSVKKIDDFIVVRLG
ncbi:MAG: glucosyltransferase domain-containing protein [Candidatus Limivicinus sp.]|jgi:hypothetical protein